MIDDNGAAPTAGAGLFDGVFAPGPVAAAVSDAAWLRALLDTEAALARAQAQCGVIPAEAAEAIGAACAADREDGAELGVAAAGGGNPVIPLVRALSDEVAAPHGAWVHHGATSQDVMDTAAMLVAAGVTDLLRGELTACAARADELAAEHAETVMLGRGMLQHAEPTTFGLRAAGWLAGLDDAEARVGEVRERTLAVQLGGATGTLAGQGEAGAAVADALAAELGLAAPALPWHTVRGRVAELAGALGQVAAVAAKVAGDIARLAQSEVGEVRERADGAGGSSAMPHKRNPIASVLAVGNAEQAPGLVATLLSAGGRHEHERAAGAWHAEWLPLTQLLRTTAAAVWWLRRSLERLEVDVGRIARNTAAHQGVVLSGRVAQALARDLGRNEAHEAVREAVITAVDAGEPVEDALLAHPVLAPHLDRARVAELLDASTAVGAAVELVARARERHGARHRGRDASPPGS